MISSPTIKCDPVRSDVLVIGGGIVGCSTAYYLAQRGVSVRVLERGRVGSEQSSRAWGFVRQQGRHPAEVALAAEAARMWGSLSEELGEPVDFVKSGILVLAENEADEQRIAQSACESKEYGVDARMLASTEVRSLMPELAGSWRAGMYAENDGHAEPRTATLAFAKAARRAGVSIEEDCLVESVQLEGGRVAGVLAGGRFFKAPIVLCAGGVGTAPLSRTLGIYLPIQVVRACVAETARTNSHMRIPVWAPRVAFRPRLDGSFVVGNGYRGIDAEHDLTPDSFRHLWQFLPTFVANWQVVRLHIGRQFIEGLRREFCKRASLAAMGEPEVNAKLVAYNKAQFDRVLPAFSGVELARSWAGRIDATPDLIPIIGAPDGPEGFFVAAGFNGHGLALGPVVGKQLSQLLIDGRTSIDLSMLRPQRFKEGAVLRRKGAL